MWTGSTQAVARTNLSNFRTACFERFGGLPWLAWYLAIGDIPPELVDYVNEFISDKVRAEAQREPSRRPVPGPKLSARSAAIRAGESPPPKVGVQHTVVEAKQARKRAKALDKQVERAEEEWRAGTSSMGWRRWASLLEEREARLLLTVSQRTCTGTMTLMQHSCSPTYVRIRLQMHCQHIHAYLCICTCNESVAKQTHVTHAHTTTEQYRSTRNVPLRV